LGEENCFAYVGGFWDFDQLDVQKGKEWTVLVTSQWEFRANHHTA
jgi:hypothetical protein